MLTRRGFVGTLVGGLAALVLPKSSKAAANVISGPYNHPSTARIEYNRLKARWSMEAEQDLKAIHGIGHKRISVPLVRRVYPEL